MSAKKDVTEAVEPESRETESAPCSSHYYAGTKEQRSLLLYLEARSVDNSGRVDGQHMNGDDFEQAAAWHDAGFIGFGRIASEDCSEYGSYWVTLSDAAWEAAHRERRASAERMLAKRNYRTTAEKRASA